MTSIKNTLATAILATLSGTAADSEGAIISAASKRAAIKAKAKADAEDKQIGSLFTPAQLIAIEKIGVIGIEYREVARSYRHQMQAQVNVIWPGANADGAVDYVRYAIVRDVIRHHFAELALVKSVPATAEYAAIHEYDEITGKGRVDSRPVVMFRLCVAERNGGKLPVPASGKSKRPKYSPKVWGRGMDSAVTKLIKQVAKVPRKDVDADALKAFTAALKALDVARKELNKRIAA